MSLLEIVKRELLAKNQNEKAKPDLAADIQTKRQVRGEIINRFNSLGKENRRRKETLKDLERVLKIYTFMDKDLQFCEHIVNQYNSIITSSEPSTADLIAFIESINSEVREEIIETDKSISDIEVVKLKFDETLDIDFLKAKFEELLKDPEILEAISNPNIDGHKYVSNIIENFREIIEVIERCSKISNTINELKKEEKLSEETRRTELEELYGTELEVMKKINETERQIAETEVEIERLKQQARDMKSEIDKLEELRVKSEKRRKAKDKDPLRKNFEYSDEQIEKARTIRELGFSSIDDIRIKLGKEVKGYVIIPIPNDAKTFEDVLNREVDITIKTGVVELKTTFNSKLAYGMVNSDIGFNGEEGAIIIPIDSLETDYIAGIRNEIIQLKRITGIPGTKIILPVESKFEDSTLTKYDVSRCEKGTVRGHIKEFLGDIYSETGIEYEYYPRLTHIVREDEEEKTERDIAISKVLATDSYIGTEQGKYDSVYVDGRSYSPDLSKVQKFAREGKYDSLILQEIIDQIRTYLNDSRKNPSVSMDNLYGLMIKEYMRLNKKTRAEYYKEDNTILEINGKTMSIKPPLAPTNDGLVKRFTRKDEDIAYKTMKLATIINKFAHLDFLDEQTSKTLFYLKFKFLAKVVSLAKNNPNIYLSKSYDQEENCDVIYMEIPGYSTLSLHSKGYDFEYKENVKNLRERDKDETFGSSMILVDGVNTRLLEELLKMSYNERQNFFIKLVISNPGTFQKLLLRLGYSIKEYSVFEDGKFKIDNNKVNNIVSEICNEEFIKTKIIEMRRKRRRRRYKMILSNFYNIIPVDSIDKSIYN